MDERVERDVLKRTEVKCEEAKHICLREKMRLNQQLVITAHRSHAFKLRVSMAYP